MEIRQIAGMPAEKYRQESHASILPEAAATKIQTAAPPTAATRHTYGPSSCSYLP
jgi:hypothetical protein